MNTTGTKVKLETIDDAVDDFGGFIADDIAPLFDPFTQPTEPRPPVTQPPVGSSTAPPFNIADNVTLIILILIGSLIGIVAIAKVAKVKV